MTDLRDILTRKQSATLGGVPHGAESYALAQMAAAASVDLLYVAASDRGMEAMRAGLSFFAPGRKVILLPAWDCLPYDRASPNPTVLAERVTALAALCTETATPRIVLTTMNAALQKLPSREHMRAVSFTLKSGSAFSQGALTHFLNETGYRRAGVAMEPGEYAVRGSLLDIFPSGAAQGIRLDSFGDTLESIRTFDPVSQRSQETLPEITLHAASEVIINAATTETFRNRYRAAFGAGTAGDPVYEAVSAQRFYPGMEHLLPLFYERLETIFDYLPEAAVILDSQANAALTERVDAIAEYYDARRSMGKTKHYGAMPYHPLPPDALYLDDESWQRRLEGRAAITLSPFVAEGTAPNVAYRSGKKFAAGNVTGSALFEALSSYASAQRNEQRSTLIACYSQGSRERINAMLHEHGLHPLRIESFSDVKNISGKTIGLAVFALGHGFEADALAVVSEQDLLGERIVRAAHRRKSAEQIMAMAANFMPGELVVHREHGIGRFEGLVALDVQEAKHDCLKIIYDEDAKLFLPVENIDVLSRYGSEEEGVKLDKLGSASWQSRKARLKERISIAAEELLATAAARSLGHAAPFAPPQGPYEEFCARFPYGETEDQDKAIADVLADIASGKPTDRLICGDVGFGKTEVALRAAFVAVSSQNERGKVQVAIVCPTTLLCRQHFHTFSERFAGVNVVIRQMSRLSSAKENKKTFEGLADGSVHIVIGTHALLGKGVTFRNLGLLVIDEEQHFGVAQKEKLKSLKSDIHVLTLTATPIPRTLQLALSGVRELSIIATPPVDRLAVRTFVMPVDPVVIREAILREHHRGGKVFYVTPRIEYMAELQLMLRDLVPDIRIASAHGQMGAATLDKTMNAFYEGKYDLLLSTSIIESGLDIRAANTIIVDRAHRFGLAQLYQLRGRVGRSKTRAYAYYTLPHHANLSHAATRRLEVMQTLDSLGAGFTLASHDMDIRGFGNLLGQEQSGHVREVGVELYQQMLEDAVAEARARMRGEKAQKAEEWSPQINLGMTVLIPEEYVQDLELRLSLYRRAADLKNEEEIHAFAAELVDRFGKLPEAVEHLLAVVRLKQLCMEAGVERIDAGPKGAVLTFRKNSFARPEKLLAYIGRSTSRARLRPDHKLVLMREWDDAATRLRDVRDSISEIAKLAA